MESDTPRKSTFEIIYPNIYQQFKELRILVVGVGGIGCEVLKSLVKLSVGHVCIIDLDTIQFLFHHVHRGHSKSLTAQKTLKALNPNLSISAIHGNIKDQDTAFFKQFGLIVMALDNIDARTFVNSVGIRLNIPIVDAGTLGFMGQVSFIMSGKSKCYSCEPKNTKQTVYPVCTIRMRPQKPIHCVVWAKNLFQVLFGAENQDNVMSDLASIASHLHQQHARAIQYVLDKLFYQDLLPIYEKSDRPPMNLIPLEELAKPVLNLLQNDHEGHYTEKQSVENHISILKESIAKLISLPEKFLAFQKDDDNIMHFICSAANLRMHSFKIPMLSFYEVKEMSANIIPAIASTNSMVAGIELTESLKYLEGNIKGIREIYVQNMTEKVKSIKMQPPLQECHICSPKYRPVVIETNAAFFRLRDLIKIVQDNKLLEQYSISLGSSELYSNLDDYSDIHLNKPLLTFMNEKIIKLTLTNQTNGNIACYITLIHNEKEQGCLQDLAGFQNEEIRMAEKHQQMEDEYKQEEEKKKKQNAAKMDVELVIQEDGCINLDADDEAPAAKQENKNDKNQAEDDDSDLEIMEVYDIAPSRPVNRNAPEKTDRTVKL